ncbi:hypothetical protein ABIB25_005932, partial [Nakamurella sp. UYEF19]
MDGGDRQSDVDFLAVTADPVAADELRELRELHRRLATGAGHWNRHLEGSYVTIAQLPDAPGSPPWWYAMAIRRSARPRSRSSTVARHRDGTTLDGFLPRGWDRRSASCGTTRRVLTPDVAGCLFDLLVLFADVEVADDGV